MAHPYNKLRQSNVERSRVAGHLSAYSGSPKQSETKQIAKVLGKDVGSIEGERAKLRADRPNRATGGGVSKKPSTTVVNVITGGAAAAPPPPPPPMMPPPEAMAPPMPPPGPPMAGPGPGMAPPMPMRAAGGGVRDVKFKAAGGTVSFRAGGGRAPKPSDLYSPEDVKRLENQRAKGGMVVGGAGGGLGRLAKAKKY